MLQNGPLFIRSNSIVTVTRFAGRENRFSLVQRDNHQDKKSTQNCALYGLPAVSGLNIFVLFALKA